MIICKYFTAFLSIITCAYLWYLAAGMKYLRDGMKERIIHRDLKPGNIMKFISEDGRYVSVLY